MIVQGKRGRQRVWAARWGLALSIGGASLLAPGPAEGVARAAEPVTSAADHAEAQKHFAKAKELYGQGSYREARLELLEARKLDPQAKDLVFNLGIVAEKLGLFDEALENFRAYTLMPDVTDQEKVRAEGIVQRLEGAKKRADEQRVKELPAVVVVPVPVKETPAPPRGRIDAATVSAAGVAVIGLGVGAVFGIKAMAERPLGFTTGRDGSYSDFVAQNDAAHTSAVVADIGFGVGIVAAAAAVILYLARPKVQSALAARPLLGPVVGASFALPGLP